MFVSQKQEAKKADVCLFPWKYSVADKKKAKWNWKKKVMSVCFSESRLSSIRKIILGRNDLMRKKWAAVWRTDTVSCRPNGFECFCRLWFCHVHSGFAELRNIQSVDPIRTVAKALHGQRFPVPCFIEVECHIGLEVMGKRPLRGRWQLPSRENGPAGRVSESTVKATEPARRASEPTGRVSCKGLRASWEALRASRAQNQLGASWQGLRASR